METIKPEVGDVVQYNGSCPIVDRVTNILPDGVSVYYFGQGRFVSDGSFRVISETKRFMFWYKNSPIDPKRFQGD